MNRKKFLKYMADAKNQLLLITKSGRFYIQIHKERTMNDLGIIAINEQTGSASIIFFEDIESIILDGKKYDI
ncbi:MAG: hypothetical protein JXR60_01995 [Bacteroidales bacterium]|nr:hypothetical protein [Bacteroidales bacterium]